MLCFLCFGHCLLPCPHWLALCAALAVRGWDCWRPLLMLLWCWLSLWAQFWRRLLSVPGTASVMAAVSACPAAFPVVCCCPQIVGCCPCLRRPFCVRLRLFIILTYVLYILHRKKLYICAFICVMPIYSLYKCMV